MQLEKIKLAGFKSFVDPTTIPINGNLTAIVGPNGCGKSNIIDAIRWVMGESSAKHLRGGNMTDVIFNGSSGRKPVSMATVELVFDNTLNKLGGVYAQYDTLSIKRQVSRDGMSQYYLNNAKCRRKDVTDLFLGTGLGSRSYAIIEQGTISRIVESKPEDLRMHIEEAAGISKYKERRQETEQRMRNTQENLERLTDVRDEVSKQLKHLHKQAEKAEQYTQLKKQERRYKLELLALRWQAYQLSTQTLQTKLQAVVAEHNRLFVLVRDLDNSIVEQRINHKQKQLQFEQHQALFYQSATEVAQLEQTIRHNEKDQEQTLIEQGRLQQQVTEAKQNLEDDQQALQEIQETLVMLTESLESVRLEEATCLTALQQLQQQQTVAQQVWEQFRTEILGFKNQADMQQARLQQLEQQSRFVQNRLQRLYTERDTLMATDLAKERESLEERIQILSEQQAENHERLQQTLELLQQQQQHLRETQIELHSQQALQHSVVGQITSLELLQQHAMGKDNQTLQQWLQHIGLVDQQRLAECLEVETGWEVAVETVLGDFLEALCLEDIQTAITHLDELSGQSVTLFNSAFKSPPLANDAHLSQLLLDKVKAAWPLSNLLQGIYCAEDINSAQLLLPAIAAHESVITRTGEWLGSNWLKVVRTPDAKQGVLQREQQLRVLKQQEQQLQSSLHSLSAQVAKSEVQLQATTSERDSLQLQEKQDARELASEQALLQVCSTKLQQQQQRLQQLNDDIEDALAENNQYAEETATANALYRVAAASLAAHNTQQIAMEQQQLQLKTQLHSAEKQLLQARERLNQLNSQGESLRATEILTIKQLERLKLTQQQALERQTELHKKLQAILLPLDDERFALEQALENKQQADLVLKNLRHALDESELTLTQLTETYTQAQQNLESHKQQLDTIRFEQQECDVRQQTVSEQLQELEADVTEVLTGIAPEASERTWKAQLEKLTQQITNLGSINLTAIEEYQAQDARMRFLTEQHNDLVMALETLQQAINKIDKESRQRFKETFDKINTGLQQKFPKLFGGGQAYLQLTQDDLLDAGVNIIAQPPGKRNSSIQLLSGGEKALTAVALVFAIFELNPAPFCLLDEVDAPLDDANIGRFSQMVAEMSETVQFLYISHNKATMEIAKQLAGVTMKEPGVSRMVAVDIEEAVSLAEA